MQAALQQAIRGIAAQQNQCPRCGSDQLHSQGTKLRRVADPFWAGGSASPATARPASAACSFARQSVVWLRSRGITSPQRCASLSALVGSSWPYETAAGVLKRLSGVHLSDERLRQITNEQGRAVAQAQREQAGQVLQEAVRMEQIRAQREQSAPVSRQGPPDWLPVGLDGGWVPSCEQAGGMEGEGSPFLVRLPLALTQIPQETEPEMADQAASS
jgi:hypothetical protein